MKSALVLFSVLSFFQMQSTFAQQASCLEDNGKPVSATNTEVLNWLHSTSGRFTARAYVQGTVVKRYPDQTNHAHFAIDLNGDGAGDLEVIYQYDAGQIPSITPGMKVSTCGDYITAKNSPNGAIIHWVHCNSRGGSHPDGFLSIDGKVYGFSPIASSGEQCLRPAPTSSLF